MGTKLFVGSLSWGTKSETLREAFEKAGSVVDAVVITDRMSGRSKGFGFVEMATAEEAAAAIEMWNGKELDGRKIAVNEARPKEEGR
jgi:cold-inducible RNA-binding protein